MSDYTPDTEYVRAAYVWEENSSGSLGDGVAEAAFDRWLAARDAEVARKAKVEAWDEGAWWGGTSPRPEENPYREGR